MSEKGQLSRILSNRYGGFLTFAAMSPEKASAPGQPTVQQLSGLFNFKKQSKVRKVGRWAGKIWGRVGKGRGGGEEEEGLVQAAQGVVQLKKQSMVGRQGGMEYGRRG